MLSHKTKFVSILYTEVEILIKMSRGMKFFF